MREVRDVGGLSLLEKRQLLERWLQSSASTSNLSVEQHRLWMLHQLDPSVPTHVFAATRIDGPLDFLRLAGSLDELIRRNDVLRTAVADAAGRPLRIASSLRLSLPVIDLIEVPPSRHDSEMRKTAQRVARQPFDLARGPLLRAVLLRCATEEHVLFVVLHQIVADIFSLDLFLQELAVEYDAPAERRYSQINPATSFSAFATWQRQWLQSDEAARELSYWQAQLATVPILELPTDYPRPPVRTHRGVMRQRTLALAGLSGLARAEGTGIFEVSLAAFRVLLARYARQWDFAIGVLADRPRAWRDCLGPLSSPRALRQRLSIGERFTEFLRRTHAAWREAQAHGSLPFDYLVEKLAPRRDLSHTPVFQAQLVWRTQISPRPGQGLRWIPSPIDPGIAIFDLTLTGLVQGERVTYQLAANADMFAGETLDRMLCQLEALLADIARAPAKRLAELSLLSAADLQLIAAQNATAADFPNGRCIHELVEEQANRTPEATALWFAGRSLTYWELNRRANHLAHHLRQRGVGPEVRVGLYAERSPEMIIGLLATLKAGGAYVPIDPACPRERLRFLLHDSQVGMLLTQRQLLAMLPPAVPPTLLLHEDATLLNGSAENLPSWATPDNLAYLIYTSGSTGAPKGVMLSHCGVVNNVVWRQRLWPLAPSDRVLQQYSFSFDPSVWALFWPLTVGATVVLVSDTESYDATALAERLVEDGVTIYGATPTLHGAILDEPDLGRRTRLRAVFSGGEPLTAELQGRFFSHLTAVFINMYGPTEATIDGTFWVCPPLQQATAAPIGHPLANVEVYVLDEDLQLAPAGVPGEIFIAGVGLARGYLNRPDLTAERFVPHPFGDRPGARLYRTGDLGRLRSDGALEFRGRIDDQVKVRGYRIELGEIEATLRQHPTVADAAVLAREDTPGQLRLVAYVEGRRGAPASPDELVVYLERHLPHYMVPRELEVLAELPRTPSGKIDRQSLPAPTPERKSEKRMRAAPRTRLEAEIGRAFATVLTAESVGTEESFFAIGGNSVLAARLGSRLSTTYEIDLPLHEIFQDPTVRGIASTIERYRREGGEAIAAAWTADRLAAEAELDPAIDPTGLATADIFEPRRVLLTGTPGYLGCFLLENLLRETRADVYCLVRAADPESAMRRIESACRFYRIWDEAFRARIHPLPGDLAKPRLGLAPELFAEMAATLDVIYHSGALVNFVYPYLALKAPNVQGTQEVLRLACTSRLKAVHHLSTIDVLLGTRAPRPFLEDDAPLKQPERIPDGYPRSKWVAEKLVAIARDRGVPACIYRPGLVMGHSRTGATQTNCYLFVGLKGYIELGVLPEDRNLFDIIPVDYAAPAIVHLSTQTTSPGKTFHLWNPQTVPTLRVYDWVRSFGYRLHTVSRAAARELVLKVDATNPLYPFVPHFRREPPEPEEISAFDPEILESVDYRVECRNTLEGLKGSGIECPKIDEALVKSCLSFLVDADFLPPPVVSPERGSA